MKNLIKKIISPAPPVSAEDKIASYLKNGKTPWSLGYEEYKHRLIREIINSSKVIELFRSGKVPQNFAVGMDERSVEYPWIFSKLSNAKNHLLDAGSTFNFDFIVEHDLIKNKELTIYTFYPEKNNFIKNRISYVFGDLRKMYFKDNFFKEIVSHSTIEHIDMDNSIYGYTDEIKREGKSYDYLLAVREMIRILEPNGTLLITFPFGKYEHHGFFQQFDVEMLTKIEDLFAPAGKTGIDYFKYEKTGWRFANRDELADVGSYNPHTGKGKGDDGAAHCRSIACIHFIKNNQ